MFISPRHRNVWITLFVLASLWITLNLFSVFFYKTNHSFSLISRFALPGPFFSQDRITIVPHWWIRFRANGRWGSWRNPESENFGQYHQKLFGYHLLAQSSLDRTWARDLSRKVHDEGLEEVFTQPEFRLLRDYIQNEYGEKGADSVQLLYIIDTFRPETNTVDRDTSFMISFKSSMQ